MNDGNLIKNSDLTPGERRERASNAGKASGKARRRKKTLRDMTNTLLGMKASNEQVDAMLEAFGIADKDRRNLMALPVAMFLQAMQGNAKAAELLATWSDAGSVAPEEREDDPLTASLKEEAARLDKQ